MSRLADDRSGWLGPRLLAIVALVPRAEAVADIGTDHAKVPIALVESGRSRLVIATDVRSGPLAAAGAAVARNGLTEQIELRQADGLAALAPGEVEGAVLAGLGGPQIVRILQGRPEVVSRLDWLVVQPMGGAHAVRAWLRQHGWGIDREELVREGRRIHEIFRARRQDRNRERHSPADDSAPLPALEDEVSPLLLQQRPPLFEPWLEQRLARYRRQLAGLDRARSTGRAQTARRQAIEARVRALADLLILDDDR